MSRQTHIFVGTEEPGDAVMTLVEQTLDRQSRLGDGGQRYIRIDPITVYVGPHEFDDDDILGEPDGTPIPLHSQYPHWIEVRDALRDQQRQEDVARRIFESIRSRGRWKAVLIDDMQHVLETFDPAR